MTVVVVVAVVVVVVEVAVVVVVVESWFLIMAISSWRACTSASISAFALTKVSIFPQSHASTFGTQKRVGDAGHEPQREQKNGQVRVWWELRANPEPRGKGVRVL